MLRRGGKNTQKNCTKKDLHDPDNHDGVIIHLEPDILECEVRWALESITTNKASGGDGIPVELFQILKNDAVKVLHSICQQIWKTQQWPQDLKRSVFIPIPKKGNAKECSNHCTIALISHMDGGAWKAAVRGVAEGQTRLSDFTFTFVHWGRKWQPTPVFLPGESQGRGSLWGRTESDMTEVT